MNNFDRIQKYLHQQMTKEERRLFEEELSRDSSLMEEVKIQQFEEDALEWMLRDNLHQKIQGFRKKNTVREAVDITKSVLPSKKRRLWPLAALAASLIFLIVLTFLFVRPSQANRLAEELSMQYPPVAALDLALKNSNPETVEIDSLHWQGHQFYQQKAYPKAIEKFRAYLTSTPPSYRAVDDVEFYLFLALLRNGDLLEAKSLGEKIANDSTHRFQPALQDKLEEL